MRTTTAAGTLKLTSDEPKAPVKTSPSTPSSSSATAQSRTREPRPRPPATSSSPAFSSTTTTTNENELSSPLLPPLPSPKRPGPAHGRFGLPPPDNEAEEESRYVTASWGSPYPSGDYRHFRRESSSSDFSGGFPLHGLEVNTPYLRAAPFISTVESGRPHSSLSASAAILANRARRPIRGITEDWIRQHTTDDLTTEPCHWLSDGAGDSDRSSLSGSFSGDETGWLDETDLQTPRARLFTARASGGSSRRHSRQTSSIETLTQQDLSRGGVYARNIMEVGGPAVASQDAGSIHTVDSVASTASLHPQTPERSAKTHHRASENGLVGEVGVPVTPPRPTKPAPTSTPRLKKKIPWKGKNIMVNLPRDDERGQPGKAPRPLTATETASMFQSWEQLGYHIRGFDLQGQLNAPEPLQNNSQSRSQWPSPEDMARERSQPKHQVTIPDLNGTPLMSAFSFLLGRY